jgi:hypothetical protein
MRTPAEQGIRLALDRFGVLHSPCEQGLIASCSGRHASFTTAVIIIETLQLLQCMEVRRWHSAGEFAVYNNSAGQAGRHDATPNSTAYKLEVACAVSEEVQIN